MHRQTRKQQRACWVFQTLPISRLPSRAGSAIRTFPGHSYHVRTSPHHASQSNTNDTPLCPPKCALCLERRNAEKGAICNYARLFLQTKAKSSGSNGDLRAFCWVKMGSVQPYERIGRRAHRKTERERESVRIVCRVGNLIKGSANHC